MTKKLMKKTQRKKIKKKEVIVDLNGAFVYNPKGIKVSGIGKKHFFIVNGYLRGNYFSIKEAQKSLGSKNYQRWLNKFTSFKE